MLATPALPWGSDVGGSIRLNRAVTYEQLINGCLSIIINTTDDDTLRFCSIFYDEDENEYQIQNSWIGSFATIKIIDEGYTLNIQRISGFNVQIISIQFTQEIEALPTLPWETSVERGQIKLATPVSYNDLGNGILDFYLDVNGVETLATLQFGSSLSIKVGDDAYYEITGFEGEKNILEISKRDNPTHYPLTRVEYAQ